MFQGRRVVICVPSGRYKYMRVLLPYLLAPRHSDIVDEVRLWVNTDVQSDLDYFVRMEQTFPKVKRQLLADGKIVKTLYDASRNHYQFNSSVYRFFEGCTDRDTVYFKIDDDICYIHNEFFKKMVTNVIEHQPTNYACVANVFNIPHITKILQDRGTIGDKLGHSPEGNPRCPVACTNGEFAAYIHEQFLEIEAKGEVESLFFDSHTLSGRQRIGTMAWAGESFAPFGGRIGERDEVELTTRIPETLHKPLWIVGDALVSHFAFSHQRAVLEDKNDILKRYQDLSIRLNGDVAA
jgi:hypothetical protein